MLARRSTLMLAAVLFLSPAVAQTLRAPNYYLFQLPRLVAGAPVTGALTTDDGQNFKDGSYLDLFAIDGHEGDRLSLSVASYDFDAYVTLFDPYGYLVAANDDYQGMGGDAGLDVTLYQDGTYLLVVSGFSQWDTGEYTVELRSTGTGTPTAGGNVAVPGSIGSQITVDMPLHPNGYVGPTEYFSFALTQEALILFTLTSTEFDTVLTVYDEYGNEIGQNDDYGMVSDSRLALPLLPGNYLVAASSYYTGEGGYYDLTIDKYLRAP